MIRGGNGSLPKSARKSVALFGYKRKFPLEDDWHQLPVFQTSKAQVVGMIGDVTCHTLTGRMFLRLSNGIVARLTPDKTPSSHCVLTGKMFRATTCSL